MRESVRIQMSSHGEVRRSATGVVVESTPAGDGAPARSIVMTNAHVADPEGLKDPTYAILIEQHGRVVQTLPAKVIAMGQVPDLDLALLEVDAALPSAELAREDAIDVGDDVVVIGAPYGRSLSVSGGLVSQLEPEDGAGTEPRYSGMKTDAAIGYGCSGGGVFEVPSGQLVGIVEGYRTARVNIDDNRAFDVPMPGETFVAPVTKVRRFLTEHFAAVHPGKVAPTATATALAAGPMPAPTTPTAPIGEPRTAAH
jgi:S1-C subfamily serine protease